MEFVVTRPPGASSIQATVFSFIWMSPFLDHSLHPTSGALQS